MCFVASMLCWLAPSKTYPTEIYRFTLAQKASLWHKNHFRPAYIKRNDIHHSQNNEETFEKTICPKTCNSKIPKETNMEKDWVFCLNCWKYSLTKEKQSLKQDNF